MVDILLYCILLVFLFILLCELISYYKFKQITTSKVRRNVFNIKEVLVKIKSFEDNENEGSLTDERFKFIMNNLDDILDFILEVNYKK